MSGLNIPLGLTVNNAASWLLTATLNGAPLNLNEAATPGPFTARVVFKAAASSADVSGTTYSSGSANLSIAPGTQGQMTLTVPATLFTTAGTSWWRCDIIDVNENPYSILFGQVTVIAA